MEKSNEVELRIKDAAYKVFIANGYDGATMRDIAAEAGINSAMLHYYFRSKDNLFDATVDMVIDWAHQNIFSALSTDKPIFDKIRDLISNYIDALRANPLLPNFIFNELNRNPKRIADKVKSRHQFGCFVSDVSAQLNDEIARGNIRSIDPLQLFFNIVSLSVFSILAKPMIKELLDVSDADYNAMLEERKQLIADFVINAIKK